MAFNFSPCLSFRIQLRKRLFVKWKAWKVHYFNKRASNSLALYRCATAMEVTAKCSADHLENVGVLIDTAMSYRGQRPKECLTVVLMVSIFSLFYLTICKEFKYVTFLVNMPYMPAGFRICFPIYEMVNH